MAGKDQATTAQKDAYPAGSREGGGLPIAWFFGFFLLSGFCSLVYEVIWLRLAMAKFGVTTPMVSIVLSVFMAGLGLGSWGGGALAQRLERAQAATFLRLYGLTELLIGASALLVPLLLTFGYHALGSSGQGLTWNSSTYYLASGSWVTVSLLPWCTCMGATILWRWRRFAGPAQQSRSDLSAISTWRMFSAPFSALWSRPLC
jgi:hypothetical protein